jgi:acetolactate synthase-1/2/3 large subunit
MKLADYVINYLTDQGVKQVFAVYGSAIGDLVDAFNRNDHVSYVSVMHEQAGAFAAETLTKVSGELGVTLVTSGPGGQNLLTGIANCWFDSIPNLYITGQTSTEFQRKDESVRQIGFQENDIVSSVAHITKYSVMVTDAQKIRWHLDKAMHEARGGRPGPVLIDIPMDIQKIDIDPEDLEAYVAPPPPGDDAEVGRQIEQYLDDLQAADRPVLLIGGGIHTAGAVDAVRALGLQLGVPCIPTWNALDIFTADYENFRGLVGTYGGPGRNFTIQNSDLLLTIGSRISGRITGGVPESFARGAKKYFVDIDVANLTPEFQEVKADENVLCDANRFIADLSAAASKRSLKSFSGWLDTTAGWLKKYPTVLPEYYAKSDIVHPYVFMRKLSDMLTKDDVIVADCGGNVVVTNQVFQTKFGQRLLSSNGNSPMGYSFAGAIGAAHAEVKGEIICIIGDGGFNTNIQELQTVKNLNLPIKTFILNNHAWGITKAYEDTNFGGRYVASGPDGYHPPNFLDIVEAYKIPTTIINNNDEIESKIRSILDHDGPIVCDVHMPDYYTYEPRIFGWSTPIEDMYPYLPREEFKENMFIDPVEGWETPAMPTGPEHSNE